MKKLKRVVIFAIILLLTASTASAWFWHKPHKARCASIRSGTIYTPMGVLITPGWNESGFNYQRHLFYGSSCDLLGYERDTSGWEQCGTKTDPVIRKIWNNAYLSKRDCDHDGLLDKHHGFPTYLDSKAEYWQLTVGTGTPNGPDCTWWSLVHCVAAKSTDYKINRIWYNQNGEKLGPVAWNYFIIVDEWFGEE